MSDYNGKCPVCSGQLFLYNETLTCLDHPGHFEIKKDLFELTWNKHDSGGLSDDNVLKILLGGNTAPKHITYQEVIDELKSKGK